VHRAHGAVRRDEQVAPGVKGVVGQQAGPTQPAGERRDGDHLRQLGRDSVAVDGGRKVAGTMPDVAEQGAARDPRQVDAAKRQHRYAEGVGEIGVDLRGGDASVDPPVPQLDHCRLLAVLGGNRVARPHPRWCRAYGVERG